MVRLRAEARASGGHEQSRVGFNHETTRLLQAWGSGDASTLEQLMPIVYNELHWLADRYMAAEQPGQTLQTTALVHEVYSRMRAGGDPFQHFFDESDDRFTFATKARNLLFSSLEPG